jgi:hypothetical protein
MAANLERKTAGMRSRLENRQTTRPPQSADDLPGLDLGLPPIPRLERESWNCHTRQSAEDQHNDQQLRKRVTPWHPHTTDSRQEKREGRQQGSTAGL